MKLPIGYDVFGEIIDRNFEFIDKTLFIKELLDNDQTKILLITRPRRFGKTLNLTMLQYFFSAKAYGQSTAGIFDNLKIAACGDEYMQHQGQYPVIFVTLKDVKDHCYDNARASLGQLISRVYREYKYVLSGNYLDESEKNTFLTLLEARADETLLKSSLFNLCYYLYQYHGVKPWLLIDEYDSPLHAAYLHDYYEPMISLMRDLLGAALKTNTYLNRAVLTGILRIAKESLFSGLNNLEVYSLLNNEYSQHFGFTETEMSEILIKANLMEQSAAIRQWYNGYQVGDTVVYNPWSIANCVNKEGELKPYWVNTSGNELIKQLLARADVSVKLRFEGLLQEQPIQAIINEYVVFGDLEADEGALYSLLLFSGYLKAITSTLVNHKVNCELIPPNYEVMALYQDIVEGWFSNRLGDMGYQRFLKVLLQGNIEEFIYILQNFLLESMSYFDIKGTHPEKFYHGFVLGLVVSLRDTHLVKSNQESGFGRYDVMLIPKDPTQLGLILEFKTVHDANMDLTQAAQMALQQINDRNYAAELNQQGISRILKMGLAFRGKQVAVLTE